MPSGKELSLWWAGEAESMFVYYLTGAVGIALIASFIITRSLRRNEPVVTELLHEDNVREDLVTYLLKIVTSPLPGCGCPASVKVFMQLTGEKRVSQYFQLRSNTGGKAMFQRGFTDILLFKVPESVGEIKSVNLLVAGLDGDLTWKLEETQLYSPSTRDRIDIPVTATVLEVLDHNNAENMLAPGSRFRKWKRIQLLYHQWLAGYGNAVRVGAFTEVVSVIILFMSLYTLLMLSQIFYIYLSWDEHTSLIKTAPIVDEEEDSDTFYINFTSLLIGTFSTTVCCCLLTLGLEILMRSVRSREKSRGKAYFSLHDCNTKDFSGEDKLIPNYTEYRTFFTCPLFLRSNEIKENILQDETVEKSVKHTKDVAFYLKQLFHFLQIEHRKHIKKLETLRKIKAQEAVQVRINLEREEYEKSEEELEEDDAEEEAKDTDITLPDFNQMSWTSKYLFSGSYDSADSECSIVSESQKSKETYLDTLKRKVLSRTSVELTPTTEEAEHDDCHMLRDKWLHKQRCKTENSNETGSADTSDSLHLSQLAKGFDRNYNAPVKEKKDTVETSDRNASDNFYLIEDTSESSCRNPSATDSMYESAEGSDKYNIDITKEDLAGTESFLSAKIDRKQAKKRFSEIYNWIKRDDKEFMKACQLDQKAWCRKVITELCELIRYTREMLLKEYINVYVLREKLLDTSHSILQLLMVACSISCTIDQYNLLNTREMLSFLWHMSMEILVYILHEIFHDLQQRDNVVLADLVLQSHSVMVVVSHAVYPIMYMVQHGVDKVYLMSFIPLNKDMECMVVELLKCCFELVVKYNLVLWQNLKVLVTRDIKHCLDEVLYLSLCDFMDGNIHELSTESTVVKKLCNFVEESSKQEAWDEVHDEKKFYTTLLVKIQLLKALSSKIKKKTRQKNMFDKKHDLLPKEPKSRLQLLVERRRKKEDVDQKHVKWGKDVPTVQDTTESIEKLEEHSKELGQFVENLTAVYDKLKRMLEKQGLPQSANAAKYLAQAALHPHVVLTLEEAKTPGKYKFDNYLHLRRTEVLLSQFYELTVNDLVAYLLESVIQENNLRYNQQVNSDAVLNDIIIKMDTVVEMFSKDVDSVMRRCIKVEQHVLCQTKDTEVTMLVEPSVNSLLLTPTLQKWSGPDLTNCTQSEMSELGKMLEEEQMDMIEVFEYYKNSNCPDQNNSYPDIIYVDDIEIDTNTISLADIKEDLKPLKGYLEYIKSEETMRNMVTQMGYIERAKQKRQYLSTIHINNIIDSYYMIDEGDDSKTLTKAGLYQLEHDCTGEDRKPLGAWVKNLTIMFMLLSQILVVVYITMIGGQFSTTELQEWMCYFLLAVAVFGFVLEPFRACIVALYVTKLENKIWPKRKLVLRDYHFNLQ